MTGSHRRSDSPDDLAHEHLVDQATPHPERTDRDQHEQQSPEADHDRALTRIDDLDQSQDVETEHHRGHRGTAAERATARRHHQQQAQDDQRSDDEQWIAGEANGAAVGQEPAHEAELDHPHHQEQQERLGLRPGDADHQRHEDAQRHDVGAGETSDQQAEERGGRHGDP